MSPSNDDPRFASPNAPSAHRGSRGRRTSPDPRQPPSGLPSCTYRCASRTASCARRPGRKPWLCCENVGSNRGCRTCRMACWMNRSSTVGMPSSRSPPPLFGIVCLFTGCGWYVPASSCSRSRRPVSRAQVVGQLSHGHPVDAGTALVLPHSLQRELKVAAGPPLHQPARSWALGSVRRRTRFHASGCSRGFTPTLLRRLHRLPGLLWLSVSETHDRFALLLVRPFTVNVARLLRPLLTSRSVGGDSSPTSPFQA
jgi:hypothetical protein